MEHYDEDLLVKKILHTIFKAVFWEETADAMLELFACIEMMKKQTSRQSQVYRKLFSIIKECYSDGINLRKQPGDCMLPNSIWHTVKKKTGSSLRRS